MSSGVTALVLWHGKHDICFFCTYTAYTCHWFTHIKGFNRIHCCICNGVWLINVQLVLNLYYFSKMCCCLCDLDINECKYLDTQISLSGCLQFDKVCVIICKLVFRLSFKVWRSEIFRLRKLLEWMESR